MNATAKIIGFQKECECLHWGREVAAKVNLTKYDVTPILQHLSSLTPY